MLRILLTCHSSLSIQALWNTFITHDLKRVLLSAKQYFPSYHLSCFKQMEGEKQMRGCIKLLLVIASRYWNRSVLCGSNLIALAVWWVWEDHVPVWTPRSTWSEAIKGSMVQGKFIAIFFSPWLQNKNERKKKRENSYVCNTFWTFRPQGSRTVCYGSQLEPEIGESTQTKVRYLGIWPYYFCSITNNVNQ